MFVKKVSMTSKWHNRRLQPNQWYPGEDRPKIIGIGCILFQRFKTFGLLYAITAHNSLSRQHSSHELYPHSSRHL